MNGPISIIIIKLSLGSEAWGIKQKKSHSDWGMNNTFLSFYLPMPFFGPTSINVWNKQIFKQLKTSVYLMTGPGLQIGFFFEHRACVPLGYHFTYGTNYADFQLIFFKCKANFPLKIISFILFNWSVWSFFSTIGTIVFRCGTMLVRHFLQTDCYFVSLQYWH